MNVGDTVCWSVRFFPRGKDVETGTVVELSDGNVKVTTHSLPVQTRGFDLDEVEVYQTRQTPIDIAQARQLLQQAMETQGPDFVYCNFGGGCYYTTLTEEIGKENDNRRKTGCLIGVALDLAGETRHHKSKLRVGRLAEIFPDMMTSEAAQYFQDAQDEQDNRSTWGQALAKAEHYYQSLQADII